MNSQCSVTQSAAGNGLPRALDRQLLDLVAQPVDADSGANLEVHSRGFHNAHVVSERKLHDVQRGIVSLQAGHARRQLVRQTRRDMLLAVLLETLAPRAAEDLADLRLQLAYAAAELRYRSIDLQLALAMCEQPVGHVAQQGAGLERALILEFGRHFVVQRLDLRP